MILLSSTIYDILLCEADKHLSSTTITSDSESTASCMHNRDTDDVYFRFGGATLASMLKRRYKDIRMCGEQKRETLSLEIAVLQAIRTTEKSCMPDYL